MMKNLLLACAFSVAGIVGSSAQSPGNALHFDGTNDIVTSTLPAVFNNISSNDFTIECWVYPNTGVFSRVVFAQLDASNFATLTLSNTRTIYFYVGAGGTQYSSVTSASLPLDTWSHVAVRWTASSQVTEIFINGVLQSTTGGGSSSTGTDNIMTLGSRPDGAQFLAGAVDELRIWDIALPDCVIEKNMNASLSGTEDNLVRYYKFDEGTGEGANAGVDTLVDYAGNNPGTLSNFALTGTSSNWITSTATINTPGLTTVSENGVTLTADRPGATYQWLDCNNNFAVIVGETNQSFTATTNGSYAVQVTFNGCTDTSSCFNVVSVGIADRYPVTGISIYPNPASNVVKIALDKQVNGTIRLTNVIGEIIREIPVQYPMSEINVSDMAAGIYFVTVTAGEEIIISRLIKE